jgi:hypothetical protein
MKNSKKEKEQKALPELQVCGTANDDKGVYIDVNGVVVLVKFSIIS